MSQYTISTSKKKEEINVDDLLNEEDDDDDNLDDVEISDEELNAFYKKSGIAKTSQNTIPQSSLQLSANSGKQYLESAANSLAQVL